MSVWPSFGAQKSGEPTNIEIRRLYTPEDFGDQFTDEQREAVARREESAAPGYRSV